MTVIGDFQCFANSYIRVFPTVTWFFMEVLSTRMFKFHVVKLLKLVKVQPLGVTYVFVRMMGILLRKKATKLQNLLRLVDMYG